MEESQVDPPDFFFFNLILSFLKVIQFCLTFSKVIQFGLFLLVLYK